MAKGIAVPCRSRVEQFAFDNQAQAGEHGLCRPPLQRLQPPAVDGVPDRKMNFVFIQVGDCDTARNRLVLAHLLTTRSVLCETVPIGQAVFAGMIVCFLATDERLYPTSFPAPDLTNGF